jgi:RNA polymerase sigma-54 factor
MGLEQKLSLRLSQRLVMTPTLQQAIKLLQMTRLELQDVVNQELVSNPVLDEEDPSNGSTPDEEPGAAETRELELASSAEAPDAALEAAVADDREFAAAETAADARAESAEALPAPTSDVPAPEPVVDASTGATDEPFSDLDLEAYFGDYMEGTSTAPRMSEEARSSRSRTAPSRRPGSRLTSRSSSASRTRLRTCARPAGS